MELGWEPQQKERHTKIQTKQYFDGGFNTTDKIKTNIFISKTEISIDNQKVICMSE